MKVRTRLASFWTVVIFALCWIPRVFIPGQEKLPKPFLEINVDKLIHLGIFFVFAVLWMRVKHTLRQSFMVFFAGIALATITELGQENRIVNRDCNLEDGLADQAGVVVGILAFWMVVKFGPGASHSKLDLLEGFDANPQREDRTENSHNQAHANRD